jgi:hypothetical protein
MKETFHLIILATICLVLLGTLLIAEGVQGMRRGWINRFIGGGYSRFESGLCTRDGDGWMFWFCCVFFWGLGTCLIVSGIWFWFEHASEPSLKIR